jgi:ubiquitin C-terminal hydrolase
LQNHPGGLKSNSWDYHPVLDSKANGYVGLVNLGATCYMNSLLQQLYMMPAMRAGVLSLGRLEKDADSLLYQLQLIFAHLQESERSSYKPEGFCVAHKDWGGNPTNVHLQQDVDEFFHQLCQRLESITKGSQQEKLLHTLFGGTLSNEIRSQTKDFPYYAEREEEFFTISLDIKNKRNIQEALDLYVKGDKLEGDNAYYCDKYERKLDVEKRVCLKRLSNTLILHLKRFDFDFNIQKKMKINDYCEFPLRFNMYPWTKEGLMQKRGVTANEASGETKPTNQPSSYYEYELVGVLVHSGDAEGGHYYSYIKERATKQRIQAPCWSEFNDNCVFPFDSKSLASECFGGEETTRTWDSWTRKYTPKQIPKQRSAYMLFYERIQPEVSVTVALPEEASPSISVSNFDLEKSSHTSHVSIWE